MRAWIKEPLLHFLLIGAALFVAYGALDRSAGPAEAEDARTVHVTGPDVDWMVEIWSRQWQRPPTDDELAGLLTDFLREELLAREARALGLDEGDLVVRRRLAQKMEFLLEDGAAPADPGLDELAAFHAARREHFVLPARIDFTHIYFRQEPGAAPQDARMQGTLNALRRGTAEAQASGDRFLGESVFENVTEREVSSVFGPEFGRAVFALTPGDWQGPLASGLGQHLVRVAGLRPAVPLEFDAVQAEALALWRREHAQGWRDAWLAELLGKYRVVADERLRPIVDPLLEQFERAP